MEWIEVFVATSQIGLEPVEGVLYQCGLTGLMIHDEADLRNFWKTPTENGIMWQMSWWRKRKNWKQELPFSCAITFTAENSLHRFRAQLAAVKGK